MLLLLSGNRNYTITELAEKFNTSERTIQRYIASFKETGFVFTLSEGRYRIEKMDKDFHKLSNFPTCCTSQMKKLICSPKPFMPSATTTF